MLAPLLLLASAQDPCSAFSGSAEEAAAGRPIQASGDGLWIGGIAFAPSDIDSAKAALEEYTGQWMLTIRFTPEGNRKFIEAQRCGVGKRIELSIDRKLISRPVLNEEIKGGQANISGGWPDMKAVEAVAARLTSR